MLISDLITLTTQLFENKKNGTGVNSDIIGLGKSRIRSLSSFSSNTIFYFPMIVSDQCTAEEVTMISRAMEKQYATFVVACISLIPFHRIRSGDQASIDEYLKQFHQNMGIKGSNFEKAIGLVDTITESYGPAMTEDAQNFFMNLWRASQEKHTDPYTFLAENYQSMLNLYNESALDSYTQQMVDRAHAIQEEVSDWGFMGRSPIKADDIEDTYDIDYDDLYDVDDDDDSVLEDMCETVSDQLELSIDEATKCKPGMFRKRMQDCIGSLNRNNFLSFDMERSDKGICLGYWNLGTFDGDSAENALDNGNAEKCNDTLEKICETIQRRFPFVESTCIDRNAWDLGSIHLKLSDPIQEAVDEKIAFWDMDKNQSGRTMDEFVSDMKDAINRCDVFPEKRVLRECAKALNRIQSSSDFSVLSEYANSELMDQMENRSEYYQRGMRDFENRMHTLDESTFIEPMQFEEFLGTMDEAASSAIRRLKNSLNTVTVDQIKQCTKPSQLDSYEKKLNRLKEKYTKYVENYKAKYTEKRRNWQKTPKARFNNMVFDEPKTLMRVYHSMISDINKKLAAIKRQKKVINKKILKESASVVYANNVPLDESSIDFLLEAITADLDRPLDETFILDEADTKWDDNLDTPKSDPYNKSKDPQDRIWRDQNLNPGKTADKLDTDHDPDYGRRRPINRNNLANDRARSDRDAARLRVTRAEADAANLRAERLERDNQAQRNRMNQTREEQERNANRMTSRLVTNSGNARQTRSTFGNQVFTDMQMKKANEMLPTFTRVNIGFIVDETNEVVNRDILLGVKTYIHRVPTKTMVDDLYSSIINKRKFLKFIKYVTGEERSLADLLFGIRELKSDATSGTRSGNSWRAAFHRRRRWSKMSIPYLMSEYTPNGTVVITMNEVEYIKENYGVDIMQSDHIQMLMDDNFLLAFVILDQSNEIAYIRYDGHNYGMQEYSYNQLERERSMDDRMMRELYRSFSR